MLWSDSQGCRRDRDCIAHFPALCLSFPVNYSDYRRWLSRSWSGDFPKGGMVTCTSFVAPTWDSTERVKNVLFSYIYLSKAQQTLSKSSLLCHYNCVLGLCTLSCNEFAFIIIYVFGFLFFLDLVFLSLYIFFNI